MPTVANILLNNYCKRAADKPPTGKETKARKLQTLKN